MTDERESDKKVTGGTGITAGRDVTFGDVSGRVVVGENVTIRDKFEKHEHYTYSGPVEEVVELGSFSFLILRIIVFVVKLFQFGILFGIIGALIGAIGGQVGALIGLTIGLILALVVAIMETSNVSRYRKKI